jgi:hypothetical protein
MGRRTSSTLLAFAFVLATALPLAAQNMRGGGMFASHRGHGHTGGHGARFDPRPGFQPFVPSSGVPVFGWGFDAYHFFITQPQQPVQLASTRGFQRGFAADRFAPNLSFIPFVPFVPVFNTQPIVVVVQQPVPVQMPVPLVLDESQLRDLIAEAGAADDWPRLRVAPDSFPVEQPRLPPLTLLVLPNNTIVAVTTYWLEGDTIYYVTSTGERGAVPFDALDWETTTRINSERSVQFALRAR